MSALCSDSHWDDDGPDSRVKEEGVDSATFDLKIKDEPVDTGYDAAELGESLRICPEHVPLHSVKKEAEEVGAGQPYLR